jgi:hypothetical protein
MKYFLIANFESDHIFPLSRDPWGYGYMTRTKEPNFQTSRKSNGLQVGQRLLFWIMSGASNFLIKQIVDPSTNDGNDLLWAMLSTNVLFTMENVWTLVLHLPLLRVVRQVNHVGFWMAIEVVEWWEARIEAQKESASSVDDVERKQRAQVE